MSPVSVIPSMKLMNLQISANTKIALILLRQAAQFWKQLESGEISEERYNNYIKIYKESLYNEMSYVEKRKKDKKFGKYVNTTMKDVKKIKGRE